MSPAKFYSFFDYWWGIYYILYTPLTFVKLKNQNLLQLLVHVLLKRLGYGLAFYNILRPFTGDSCSSLFNRKSCEIALHDIKQMVKVTLLMIIIILIITPSSLSSSPLSQ